MTSAIPPRSWTIVSVLERSYAMAKDNFPAFVTVTVIFGAVSLVVDVLSLGLLAGFVHLACSVATSICITWATFQVMAGRKPDWEPILRQVQGPRFGWLLLLGAIQYFVIALSMILVIPPFFLLPLWAVALPAMMIERTDIAAAFWRSVDLTRGRRLAILGTFLLAILVFGVGAVVIVALLGHGALAHLVLWIYAAIAATAIQPLPAIFYVLLCEEKEGVTAGQIVAALD